jgi:hypothetical protein
LNIQSLHIKLTCSLIIILHSHINLLGQPIEQTSKNWDISLSGGFHSVKISDPTYSNISQTGSGWNLGAGVNIHGKKFTHLFAFHYAEANIQAINIPGLSKYVDAGYWIFRNISSTEDNSFTLGLGAGLSTFSFSRSYEELINNNYTKEAALCMDIGASIRWRPSVTNHRLILANFLRSNLYSISAQPLYGAYAWQIPSDQPGANKTMLSAATGAGPQNTLLVVNEFSISYAISGALAAGIQYQFSYGKMAINREVSWNMNNIVAMCKLRF